MIEYDYTDAWDKYSSSLIACMKTSQRNTFIYLMKLSPNTVKQFIFAKFPLKNTRVK